jgi:hypothetical protein
MHGDEYPVLDDVVNILLQLSTQPALNNNSMHFGSMLHGSAVFCVLVHADSQDR